MKKHKITLTILIGAIVLLGATGNAQQGPSAIETTVDPPGEIRPFHVHFSDAALADLHRRILRSEERRVGKECW